MADDDRTGQLFGVGVGPLGSTHVRGGDGKVLDVQGFQVRNEHLAGIDVVHRQIEESLDLVDEYFDAIHTITGDCMYGRCLSTSYIVYIMRIVGDDEEIPQIVEILKEEIREQVPDNTEGQQDFYMDYANSLLD